MILDMYSNIIVIMQGDISNECQPWTSAHLECFRPIHSNYYYVRLHMCKIIPNIL